MRVTRLAQGFDSPVDAVMSGSKIYILEYKNSGSLWEVSLPASREGTAVVEESARATEFGLYQNYPNPFNAETMIRYRLPSADRVVLKIYNAQGQVVRTLVDAPQDSGVYTVVWDGHNERGMSVGVGTYFAGLAWGDRVDRDKMQLIK